MTSLDSAKNGLERELKDAPYVKGFLWGNAATNRKIKKYIIESVKEGVDAGDCIDWFKSLLSNNEITDEYEKPVSPNTYSGDIHQMYDILKRYEETL